MERDTVVMQDIYTYEQDGIDEGGRSYGRFVAHGIRPTFMPRLEAAGVRLPASAFRQRVMLEDAVKAENLDGIIQVQEVSEVVNQRLSLAETG